MTVLADKQHRYNSVKERSLSTGNTATAIHAKGSVAQQGQVAQRQNKRNNKKYIYTTEDGLGGDLQHPVLISPPRLKIKIK
jgi:hypothetical protein